MSLIDIDIDIWTEYLYDDVCVYYLGQKKCIA